MESPPRLNLALLPTPLHRLDRLSKEWGVELWIKRDDLTGAALSGNKIRKLEYELGDAVAKGCKAVVTCGGVGSNHCRATAVAARRIGLLPHLVLRTDDGKPPSEFDGNTLLDAVVGAEITWVSRQQYREERGPIMAGIAAALGARGLPAYVIPEGASDARGARGYVDAIGEIARQVRAMGGPERIDYLVHACGSGGTSAGLALGNEIHRTAMLPVAFAVCDDESYFRQIADRIAVEYRRLFGGTSGTPPELLIIDRYKGIGYALSTAEELKFLRRVAEVEGILLDPVYSGKAFYGMAQEIATGKTFRSGATICFLHTGGIFGLFPKRLEFAF